MRAQLIMIVVVIPLDRGVLDRAVHPFDLAVGPGVIGFRQPVLDPVCVADHVKAHGSRIDCVPVSRLLGELYAIIGQDGVDVIGHGFEQVLKELPRGLAIGLFDKLSDSVLAGPINANEEIELAFDSLNFGDIYVEEADWAALELLTFWLVTIHVW